MIEYKRFISYIYAYAGGVRDKNTGFAKAQVQGQKFELAIISEEYIRIHRNI